MRKLSGEHIDAILKLKNIKRMEPYQHSQHNMLVSCCVCENQWKATFGNLRRKRTGCPRCLGLEKLTNKKIDEKLEQRFIQRIGDYQGLKTNILWRCISPACPELNYEWNQTPDRILHKNRGCPACGTNKGKLHNLEIKLTNEEIDRRLIESGRNDVIRIGEYTGYNNHTLWQCTICFHQWSVTPGHIISQGTGCPLCKKKSEYKVKLLLQEYIPKMHSFSIQKSFSDIVPNKRSKVDFYFKIDNKEFIVEYNGEQHYEPTDRGQGKKRALKSFEYQKIKDELKRKYCKDHNIFLLEIPYWFSEKETISQLQMLNSGNYADIPVTIIPDILPRQTRAIWREAKKLSEKQK